MVYKIPCLLLFLFISGFAFSQEEHQVKSAKLHEVGAPGLTAIKEDFRKNNCGYDLYYLPTTKDVPTKKITPVLFVQDEGGTAVISDKSGHNKSSKVSIGGILLLEEGEKMKADSLLGILVFTVPKKPSMEIPSFVRPDWGTNITDTPSGCATENNAYRRILLTWNKHVGNYIYHSITAQRVRIMDSFSHYHPKKQGFDGFYQVQMVLPEAKLFTSGKVEQLSAPREIKKGQIDSLVQEHSLEVGDLINLPGGVMHRGFGGVLAQVITVPGFVPGSQFGVDHFLRPINENPGLTGRDAPFDRQASAFQVIL